MFFFKCLLKLGWPTSSRPSESGSAKLFFLCVGNLWPKGPTKNCAKPMCRHQSIHNTHLIGYLIQIAKNLPLHSQRLGHVEEPGSNSWRWPFRTRGIPTDGVSDEDFVYFLIVCFYVAGSDVFNMLQGMLQWCCDLVCRSRFLHYFCLFFVE